MTLPDLIGWPLGPSADRCTAWLTGAPAARPRKRASLFLGLD